MKKSKPVWVLMLRIFSGFLKLLAPGSHRNVFPTQIEEQILSQKALTPHYQIIVEKQNNLDTVTIKVEAYSDNTKDIETCKKELTYKIKTFVGISTLVIICKSGSLPRSEGKAVRVVDKR
ncbi:hypothetical protein [Oceanicoccus sagamiensis]|uniref:AMP-dependent ligase C-terminal domain-containing protein n=1 Tax=Oceanicoccus sagamiensis TaxID=716816 RepID=A0A1X9N9T0_9GAMM|nr:hypothetical protein [Oceanicoccus sagamiensis]ARN73834.1 hypothetical protein BST96_06725 [Oceanicoccus sagamiensis]